MKLIDDKDMCESTSIEGFITLTLFSGKLSRVKIVQVAVDPLEMC